MKVQLADVRSEFRSDREAQPRITPITRINWRNSRNPRLRFFLPRAMTLWRTAYVESVRLISEPSCSDRVIHRLRHHYRVFCLRDGRIHEDAVGAEFHGDSRVRGRTDARIHNHRHPS